MMTVTNYPNNQQLTSSALTPGQISTIIQTLTYGMLGLPTPPPSSWQPVQVAWQVTGQPFVQNPQQNVCYVSCVLEDEPYTKIRDMANSGLGTTEAPQTQTWEYTRCWRVAWCFYGPNATDSARQVHTATYADYFNNALAQSALYPVSEPPQPTRAPEEINAQWYERADFSILMYEQVNDTLVQLPSGGVVESVEIKLYDGSADDPVADFTVTT